MMRLSAALALCSLLTTVAAQNATQAFRPIFTVPAEADIGATLLPNVLDEDAVDAQDVCPGYKAANLVQDSFGLSAVLSLAGKPCNVYGTDIQTLNLTVQYQSADRLSINISPTVIDSTNASFYILPDNLVPKPTVDADASSASSKNDFKFEWSNEPSFNFEVIRKSTGDTVFSTKGSVLVYENQFIEFVTDMPENYNVYGLGEQIHGLRLGNNYTATMFAADAGDPVDGNIYGVHPFYLDTRYFETDGEDLKLVTSDDINHNSGYTSYSHGVYLRNAHPQEVLLRKDSITWRTLGGSIDLYFFDGPSQEKVTKQYQLGAIGLPAMQQYFTFGYHQCRWGYTNWTMLKDVVETFRKFDIPLETIWTDIDYMNQYRDFTTDENAFPVPEGQQFLKELHANGQHYVPIIDSAIYIPNPKNASDAYPTFNRGNDSNVFLRNPDGSIYIGTVWPGYTVFPDWQSPNAVDWWTNEVVQWHKEIAFDGIWIDMSEVSSFCVGSCGTGNVTLNPVHPPFKLPGEPGNVDYNYPEGFNITNKTEAASASSASSRQAASTSTSTLTVSTTTSYLRTTPTPGVRNINHPPYVINNVNGDLAVHAVSPNATHVNGVQEYDVHNLNGHQILNATYQALVATFQGKRPFIIGRSTFAGTGKWAGHWGGDNASKWYYMFFSIPQALSFSLFGIPMFGVDTCGFSNNSDEELCNRWMQLSAFFPFYRNHNVLASRSQEPYVWASVAEATRTAMNIRYQLLPYLYTLFHSAHTTGSTVMRALAWEFPNDPSLASADRQFLLGPSLLVTPVLIQGATSVNGVFPGVGQGEVWYDWYTHKKVSAPAGQNVTIQAPLGHIPVYIRGGGVLPTQQPGYTTTESRKNPWSLIVALSSNGTASGQLYIDDGESISPNATLSIELTAATGCLKASVTGKYVDTNSLANVTVLGVSTYGGTADVKLNGEAAHDAHYDKESKVLSLTGLEKYTKGGAWKANWELTWG